MFTEVPITSQIKADRIQISMFPGLLFSLPTVSLRRPDPPNTPQVTRHAERAGLVATYGATGPPLPPPHPHDTPLPSGLMQSCRPSLVLLFVSRSVNNSIDFVGRVSLKRSMWEMYPFSNENNPPPPPLPSPVVLPFVLLELFLLQDRSSEYEEPTPGGPLLLFFS